VRRTSALLGTAVAVSTLVIGSVLLVAIPGSAAGEAAVHARTAEPSYSVAPTMSVVSSISVTLPVIEVLEEMPWDDPAETTTIVSLIPIDVLPTMVVPSTTLDLRPLPGTIEPTFSIVPTIPPTLVLPSSTFPTLPPPTFAPLPEPPSGETTPAGDAVVPAPGDAPATGNAPATEGLPTTRGSDSEASTTLGNIELYDVDDSGSGGSDNLWLGILLGAGIAAALSGAWILGRRSKV
jgi:hypothetical protein